MTTGGNRNALNREVGVDGERDWSRGLSGCCSDMCCVCTSMLYFLGCWLSRFPSQGVVPFCALAWSFPKPSRASYICGVEALLSQVEDQHVVPIVGFMVACIVVCAAISVYYAVHAFAHVHTFAHFHRFGSIDTFQFTFLLKKKTIDKVTIIDKES